MIKIPFRRAVGITGIELNSMSSTQGTLAYSGRLGTHLHLYSHIFGNTALGIHLRFIHIDVP